MRLTRRAALAAVGVTAALSPRSSYARDYPARPVRLVVPFPPGGTTDVVGRQVSVALAEELGQSLIVDNRGGAGGVIGADLVARARTDGYTLLLFHSGITYGPALNVSLPYDVVKDFTPIGLIGSAPSALVVTPGLSARNVGEFIALAKASPGAVNFASAGTGTSSHLAPELFNLLAGIRTTHVPFRGGGPAVLATISGEVQFMIETAGSLVPQIKSGRLRALGVSSAERFGVIPDVPTIAESGLKDFVYSTWYGLWGPANLPSGIVETVNASLRRALAKDKVASALLAAGIIVDPQPTERFAELVRSDLVKWTKIIRDAGIPSQ